MSFPAWRVSPADNDTEPDQEEEIFDEPALNKHKGVRQHCVTLRSSVELLARCITLSARPYGGSSPGALAIL